MRFSLVADHWQYFAIIGPIALAAAIIRKPVPAAALLLALGALTWKQCGMYADSDMLWVKTIRQNPGCWMARNNLGNDLLHKGRVNEAVDSYREALRINPEYEEAHYNLGNIFLRKGQLDEAIGCYQAALQIEPNYMDALGNCGVALFQKGRTNDAIAQFQKMLQLRPGNAAAHYDLGHAFLQMGRVDEAMGHLRRALQLKPDSANACHDLATAFLQKGKFAEAINTYQEELQIEPHDPQVQVRLAWLLATCPQASLRNGGRAVELARQANALTGGKNPVTLRTLAAALAEVGQFGEAGDSLQQAIELAEAAGRKDLARQLNDDLNRYKSGLPLHQ
jgi:tetratricopeptide (TPR) repeat protein